MFWLRCAHKALAGIYTLFNIMLGRPALYRPIFGVGGGVRKRLNLIKKTLSRSRTRRIIIVNSAFVSPWIINLLKQFGQRKVVYIQNGVYAPFWYRDTDMDSRNREMLKVALGSDLVVFQSQFCQESFLAIHQIRQLPVKSIVLMNPSVSSKKSDRKHLYTERTATVVANSTFFQHAKDFCNGMSLALAKEGVRLCVVGWSRTPADCPNTQFYPVLSPQQLELLLQKSEVVILPDFQHAAPNIAIECLQLGKAVLYDNSGGLREILEDCGIAVGGYIFDLNNYRIGIWQDYMEKYDLARCMGESKDFLDRLSFRLSEIEIQGDDYVDRIFSELC